MPTLIVIAFSRPEFIPVCLATIPVSQANKILLIRTNGSTWQPAREDTDIISCPRATMPEAWNFGLKTIISNPTVDYILFLHDDTCPPPTLVSQMRLAFDVFRNAGVAITDSFTGGVTVSRPRHSPAVMISRKAFEDIGFFDTRFALRCDTQYMKRAEDAGFVIVATDIKTRHAGGGTTSKLFTPAQYAKQLDEERKLIK